MERAFLYNEIAKYREFFEAKGEYYMKKLLSIILALIIALSFAACGKKETQEVTNPENEVVENNKTEEKEPEKVVEENKLPEKETENKKEENKPETKPEAKPETKPEVKPESKPETTPETKPEAKPETKPEVKPEENPDTPKTVGQTLLSAFKANSSGSALSVAEALIANKIIAFSGAAMPVEEGYLTGFDNTEIKGFSEGAMFAPMIGTIPFVGYVFTLAEGTNASDFIATLKSAANLRWNICTSADEMVTGSAGNKVFFVMCPTSFEDAE